MFIQRKSFLRQMKRIRVAEGRSLEQGLRLDRNEKVDVWPPDFLANIFLARPGYFLSVYPESDSLYRKLSQHLHVKEQQLMLTSGIDGALKTLFEIMAEPGDLVGVFSPTYAMYKIYSGLFQVRLAEIGYLPNLALDQEQLDEFLSQRPVMLFVPNPNQPIESALSLAELDVLARKTHAANCLLVIDEAYHLFGCESGLPLLERHENVVIVRTFSKGFGVPSIRLGFMVSTEDNMQTLAKTRFAHESNALSNAVAEYLLDHYNLVEQYIGKVIEGRNYVKAELLKLGFKVHGNKGNFLLIDLYSSERAGRVVSFLREKCIYVKGPWQTPWDKYITITLGPVDLMKRFVEAMRVARSNFFEKEVP